MSTANIKQEITTRYGDIPAFFLLAMSTPDVAESLWRHAVDDYLENRIPARFKERLFLYLSRFCEVDYCLGRQAATLLSTSGDGAAMTGDEILTLLEKPLPDDESLQQNCRELEFSKPPWDRWPDDDAEVSECVFDCCVAIYLRSPGSARCRTALRHAFQPAWYQRIVSFLSFVRRAHEWTEAHSNLELELNVQQLIRRHERLAAWFDSHRRPSLGAIDSEPTVAEAQIVSDSLREIANETELQDSLSSALKGISDSSVTSNEKLELLQRIHHIWIETSRIGVLIVDAKLPDMPVVFCNSGFLEMTGYSREETLGKNCRFLQLQDRDQEAIDVMRDAIRTGADCTVVVQNYRKDGKPFWNEVSIYPIHDSSGVPTHFVGIQKDITERQQRTAELRRERALLEAIIRSIPDALILADLERVISFCNPAVERVFGYSPGELIGQSTSVLYHDFDDFREQGQKRFNPTASENHEPMKTLWKRKCGAVFPGEAIGTIVRDSDGNPVNFLGLIRDVTAASRMVGEQKRWYRVLDALSDGTSLGDLQRLIVRQAEEARPGMLASIMLLDASDEAQRKDRLMVACAPNVPPALIQAMDGLKIGPRVPACGRAAYTGKTELATDIRTDEVCRDYRLLADQVGIRACWSQPIFSPTNEILGTLAMYFRWPKSPSDADYALLEHSAQLAGVVIDRSRASDNQARSEERLRLVLEATNEALWDFDVARDRLWRNERFAEDFGGPDLGQSARGWWIEHLHPNDLQRVQDFQSRFHAAPGETNMRWSIEYRLRRLDGSYAIVEDRAIGSYDPNGQLIRLLGALKDLTQQRALEKEVLDIASQESWRIGTDLHDGVGQELTGMGMLADALMTSLSREPSDASRAAELKITSKLSEAIGRTLEQVRGLARCTAPFDVDREGLVSSLSDMAGRMRELYGVECQLECEGQIRFRENQTATQLYRIAQESTTNAIRHGRATQITITLIHDANESSLRIVDNGDGIYDETVHRGLGLRTMGYRAGLIGGQLTLSPAEDGGTIVTCLFPGDAVR